MFGGIIQAGDIWTIDTAALSLSWIERFLKPLVDESGSKAPVSLLRVSAFMAFWFTLYNPAPKEMLDRTKIKSPPIDTCKTDRRHTLLSQTKDWKAFSRTEPKLIHTDTSTNATVSGLVNSLLRGKGVSFSSDLLTSRFLPLQSFNNYI